MSPFKWGREIESARKTKTKKQKLASCQKICKVLNPRCGFVPYCRTTGCGEGRKRNGWHTICPQFQASELPPREWSAAEAAAEASPSGAFFPQTWQPLVPSAVLLLHLFSPFSLSSVSAFHRAASNTIRLQKFIENKYKLFSFFFFFFNPESHF